MALAQTIGTLLARGLSLGTIKTPKESLDMTVNGWEHHITFVAPWIGMEGILPARFSSDPTYPGLYLMDGAHSEKWMGNLAKIDLLYRTPDYPITNTDGIPPDEIHEDPSAQEVPVQQNLNYPGNTGGTNPIPSGWLATQAYLDANPTVDGPFQLGNELSGVTGFYKGVRAVTHRAYFKRLNATLGDTSIEDAPDPSPYVVIADAPGYDTGGCMLRLTSEVNPSGLWWTRDDRYLLNDLPISIYIYNPE